MKFNKWNLGLAVIMALALFTIPSPAQTNTPISASTIEALLQNGLITVGSPATINGQTFLVTTNASGGYVIASTGPNGNLTVTPPTTLNGALSTAQGFINANNPTNASFYGTNELVARVGAVYLQNYGQSVVEIGVEKYGLLKSVPQIGLGAALFQGNRNGSSGTAGGVGFLDYRKVIGDVSAQVGIGGGYDNWNQQPMGAVKFDVELRQNAHLGEYVGIGYGLEKGFSNASSAQTGGGLMVRGGINYAF
jgi:hypothetical protein